MLDKFEPSVKICHFYEYYKNNTKRQTRVQISNGNVLIAKQNIIKTFNTAINIKKFALIDQNIIEI